MEENPMQDESDFVAQKEVLHTSKSSSNGSQTVANTTPPTLQEDEQQQHSLNLPLVETSEEAAAAAAQQEPQSDEEKATDTITTSLDLPTADNQGDPKQTKTNPMLQAATDPTTTEEAEHSHVPRKTTTTEQARNQMLQTVTDFIPKPTTTTATEQVNPCQPATTTDETKKHLFMSDWSALGMDAISAKLVPEYTGVVVTKETTPIWDHWPHWHVQKRRRMSQGWFDVQTERVPFLTRGKRDELRKLHKELNRKAPVETRHSTTDKQELRKSGTYHVEISTAKSHLKQRLLGFFDGNWRFLGKFGDARIVKGWFRKRFDIVSAVDGQSIEHKSQEFVQNLLSNVGGKSVQTLSMRPFDKPLHLPPVPVQSDEEDSAGDLESLDSDVVIESPCKSSTGSFMYDDYGNESSDDDDDSYQRLLKNREEASRPRGKTLLDDVSSVASEDSDFVMNDAEDANDDEDFEATVEGGLKLPYQAAVGKTDTYSSTGPLPKVPSARLTAGPIHPVAMGQQNKNPHYHPQRLPVNAENVPTVTQNVIAHTFGQLPASSQTQGYAVRPNANGINHGTSVGGPSSQPGASEPPPTYTAVVPVFPNGLRIRVWEMNGRLIFFGYGSEHPSPYAPGGFQKVGDMVVGIEGHSVDHLKPHEVCEVIRIYSQGKQQLSLQMQPKV
eukprot:scaffold3042_cov152-Amphora_coffeaeformis.AAC.6